MKIIIKRGHAMATGATTTAATTTTATAAAAVALAATKTVTGTSKRVHTNRYGRKSTTHVSVWFPPAMSASTTLICLLLVSIISSSSGSGSGGGAGSATRTTFVQEPPSSVEERFDLAADVAIARASPDNANNNHIGDYLSYTYMDGAGSGAGGEGEAGTDDATGIASADNVRLQLYGQLQKQPLYYVSSPPIRMIRPDRTPWERAIETIGCKNLNAYCARELAPQRAQWTGAGASQYLGSPQTGRGEALFQQTRSAGLGPLALESYLDLINNEQLQQQLQASERIKKASPKHTPRFGR